MGTLTSLLKWNGLSILVRRTRQAGPSEGPRGTFVVSVRRGVLVTPDELVWTIQYGTPDPTSGSLRKAGATSASHHFDGHTRSNLPQTFIKTPHYAVLPVGNSDRKYF